MIRKLVRQMLAAQTLSALTVSICLLIDNIMISRYLGVQAVAAYGLANPLLLAFGAVASMLGAGVQVACSKSLGSGSREETNKGFSSAVGIIAVIAVPMTLLVLLLRNPLATLLGAGSQGELYEQTGGYIGGFVLGAPASMAALVLIPFLQMAGQTGLLIAAVLTMTVLDIAFDLLSIFVFHGGMFGMGLASTLSYYAAMLIALKYFLSSGCVFAFSGKLIRKEKIRELIAGGVPMVFNMASAVVAVFCLNRILMPVGGSEAVAALSVVMSIGNASNCISTGIGGVSLTLSGILYHEEDRTGLETLMRLLARYSVILGAAVGLLMALIAPAVVSVFMPTPGITRDMTVLGVRLFSLGFIPCCLNNALKNMYLGTERVLWTEIISVAEGAILPVIAAFFFTRLAGTPGIWFYFGAGEALTLAGIVIMTAKRGAPDPFSPRGLMLPEPEFGAETGNLLETDICSMEDVTKAAEAAEVFCLEHGQSEKTSRHIALCIEEMAANTVQHGFREGRKNHLSVRIMQKGPTWILRFRDDCPAFDPVGYIPGDGEGEALGIRLMKAMAEDARYTNSLNLNNLTLRLPADREAETARDPGESRILTPETGS